MDLTRSMLVDTLVMQSVMHVPRSTVSLMESLGEALGCAVGREELERLLCSMVEDGLLHPLGNGKWGIPSQQGTTKYGRPKRKYEEYTDILSRHACDALKKLRPAGALFSYRDLLDYCYRAGMELKPPQASVGKTLMLQRLDDMVKSGKLFLHENLDGWRGWSSREHDGPYTVEQCVRHSLFKDNCTTSIMATAALEIPRVSRRHTYPSLTTMINAYMKRLEEQELAHVVGRVGNALEWALTGQGREVLKPRGGLS
ncbi:hypothetical protein ACXWTF_13100 [Thiomicrolovo sp. ZZH C-3]